jgi:hypothetical protein
MIKIIIVLICFHFKNSYPSDNNFLENDTDVNIYALNAQYNINEKNTLFKTFFLTKPTKNLLGIRDLSALTSLLLTNIINHNESTKKFYYNLTRGTDCDSTCLKGDSGFLTENLFINLYEVKLPKRLKIFATGNYHYPEFDNDVLSIVIKKEFIENNPDDIINDTGTTYYTSDLLAKIMSELETEKKTECQKNIPVGRVGGIGIKLLNWIAHCYEEKTIESIVFLPEEMSGVGRDIVKCLKENKIVEKGDFIYITNTEDARKYCDIIKNNDITPLTILMNKDTILDKEYIAIKIYLAAINYYWNKIQTESLVATEENQGLIIDQDMSEIEKTILYSNIFNGEDDEKKSIIPSTEENIFPYLYLYYKLIDSHREPPKKIIIFLYNTLIKLLLSNKNESFKKIQSEIGFLLCIFEKISLVFQNTIEEIGIKTLCDLLQLYKKEIITQLELIEKITQEDFKKAITEKMFIKEIPIEIYKDCIAKGEDIEKIINDIENFKIPDIFIKYKENIDDLKYNYYNTINKKEKTIIINNESLNNFFLDLVLLFESDTESKNLLNQIYNKLIYFDENVTPKDIKRNIKQIDNIIYKKIAESVTIKDTTEKSYIYNLAIKLYNKRKITRRVFYSAIINCNKEEKFYLETTETLSNLFTL